MRIMLDTNVLISALVFGGQPGRLLDAMFAHSSEYQLYVSEYVDCEFRDILSLKWPDKAEYVYRAYRKMNIRFCDSTSEVLGDLRDRKDVPVLSDALHHGMDILLTGDKDFLEANLAHPKIFSPSMMEEYMKKQD